MTVESRRVAYIPERQDFTVTVESAPVDDLLDHPQHPYTQALLAAIADPDAANATRLREVPAGEPPSLLHPPAACRFHPRCPLALDRCRAEAPELRGDARQVACHEVES